MSTDEPTPRLVGDEAQLYERYGERVWHHVRAQIAGPDQLVDDACQNAWAHLLRNTQRIDRATAFPWLRTVAVREAWAISERDRREASLDAPATGPSDQPADQRATVGELVPDRADTQHAAERRATLRLVDELPGRQRDMVLMHAAGLKYDDIAQRTGDSSRTVERQLLRGRHALRALRHEAERPTDQPTQPQRPSPFERTRDNRDDVDRDLDR